MAVPKKVLDTEEGRRDYYRYDPTDPTTIRPKASPTLDPRFNAELKEKYGVDVWGDQIIRIVWAGDVEQTQYYDDGDRTIPYKGMKYPFMRISVITGYQYFTDQGKLATVLLKEQVPSHKVAMPVIEKRDLPRLHYVVEMKFTLDKLVAMGWAADPDSPEGKTGYVRNGKRYRDAPDPKGEYIMAYPIVAADGGYRDVTQADLDHIAYTVNRSKTETEQEYLERKRAEYATLQALAEADEADRKRAVWDSVMTDAERKLAKGRVLYSK